MMEKIKYKQFEFEEVSKKSKYMSIIESLLFVSGEPLSIRDISRIIDLPVDKTEEIIELLGEELEEENRGIKLIYINDCCQLTTKPENSDYIQKLLKKNTRQTMSQASLECLSIIAYKQPVTRIEIEEIRGVKSESAVQKLVERNLVKEVGRLDVIGRPKQFGTTDEFLRQFNLKDLNQLPELNFFENVEIKNDDEELNEEREDY